MGNSKKFSLIMPSYKSASTIGRALKSILKEQDYDNYELLVVMDGFDEPTQKILDEYKDNPKLKVLTIEHGGACKARNAGYKISTGDYISFFSSDFIAQPGMLTFWARRFEDNPDCAFVYGGYVLIKDGKEVSTDDGRIRTIPSSPFDPYLLTVYNYIDGGFPVKREFMVDWDENLKSLNDWDFWLSVVDKGGKGFYFPDYTYSAEIPKEGGLSYDSNEHWLERVDYIHRKHNIPNRPICVSSLNAPFHGQRTAQLIGADYKDYVSFKPHKYDTIYLVGFYLSRMYEHLQNLKIGSSYEYAPAKAVIHFIGTDVEQMVNTAKVTQSELIYRGFRQLVQERKILVLTECESTHKELADIGIESEIYPLPLRVEDYVEKPLPSRFTVGVYAPMGDEAASRYFTKWLASIAHAMPDIDFKFFGRNEPHIDGNLEATGWLPISNIIERCSCLIRFTMHDGLPISPCEFLMCGRPVITNQDLKYAEIMTLGMVNEEKDYIFMRENVVKKLREWKKELPQVNDLAISYYKDLFNPQRLKNRLEKFRLEGK